MNRVIVILGTLVATGVLTWYFPLFHVVRRDAAERDVEKNPFNAAEIAETVWKEKLPPVLADAADAMVVLAALRQDPTRAKTDYGRSVGIGRSTHYLVRGRGRVVSLDDKAIELSLDDEGTEADVLLVAGLLFGNTVRDATGLVHGDDFPSSQEFNQISAELNRIVENSVLPSLKTEAKVGETIEFVGCSEVTNLPRDVTPLKLIPLEWKVQQSP